MEDRPLALVRMFSLRKGKERSLSGLRVAWMGCDNELS